MRTLLFWTHLVTGVTAGSIVLVMSATGVLLTYEKQIIAWSERGYRVAPPAADAPRLPLDELVARVVASRPDSVVTGVTVRSDRQSPLMVTLASPGIVFVNPYTGQVLGDGNQRVRGFFRAVTDWHRWLAASGKTRATGRAITGAANLAFLLLVVTGAYLWIPRVWSQSAVRAVLWFRGGLRGRARDFNWHNTIGAWSVTPLFLIVVSGAVMSYPWANALVYRATGNEPPSPQQRPAATPGPASRADLSGVESLIAVAAAQVPGWQSITVRPPTSPADAVTLGLDRGNGTRPDKRSTLVLDPSGRVVRFQPYSSQNGGQKARAWLRFIHTGEAGGVIGQTIAGLASAGAVVLVYTGLALAWRRFFRSKSSSRAAAA
jgi:uncharacterized iron-regulated membrane protein